MGPSPEAGVAFVTNRELTQRLRTAKDRIAEGDYLTGIKYLQSVLDEKEDWFIEESRTEQPAQAAQPQNPERKPNFLSLKNAVEDTVGRLPAEARRVYEQEYGFAAKGMLQQAVASGDMAALSELARRFFHTEAGYEAVYRLGLMKADHGEPFAAALHFARLKAHARAAESFEPMLSLQLAMCWEKAGLSVQSRAVLEELKRNSPQGQIRIGDRTVQLFERDEQAGAWLAGILGQSPGRFRTEAEQWPMFRGNSGRNAVSSTASPVGPVEWSRSTIQADNPFGLTRGQLARLENELDRLAKARRDSEYQFPLPVAEPLILGDRAVFRTLQNIQAVDLATGKKLWETSQIDSRLRPVLSHRSSDRAAVPGNNNRLDARNDRSAVENYLTQRIWRDATFGLLSGDADRVYAVEEVGLADGLYFAETSRNDPFIPKPYNKLMAFGVRDGAAIWEAGGQVSGKNPLGGMFFLGPPLPLGEQLFCLAERNNEISLLVLEASTGQLEWEQRLVLPVLGLSADRERRVMGLAPSFGQGVIVCPTASGAVVAVDITRRTLLWAYEYTSTHTEDYLVANMAWQGAGGALEFSHESLHPEARWADSVPVIAEGKVLITPADSPHLHCLDLSTGELQWTSERGEGISLAGVSEGNAIVVSRSHVRALRLMDGKEAWPAPVSIPTPAGRGFLADGRLHLPLSTGEVGTVDLKHGRLVARSAWPDGETPGNLVSAGGRVVFQSAKSVGAFSSWDRLTAEIASTLKTDPDNAKALFLRGRLRLHRGEKAEALQDLRSAWNIAPNEETRTLLLSRLMDVLRDDPSKSSEYREELHQLIETPEEMLQLLMLTAMSKKTPESRSDAVRDYVELARILAGKPGLVRISDAHRVRGDAWVKARLEQLAAHADPKEFADWNRILEQELLETIEKLPAPARQQVLSGFPPLPVVEQAELALAREWKAKDELLAKTIVLDRLRKSADKKIRTEATLELAETYLGLGRDSEAYPLIQTLAKEWPEAWRKEFDALKPAKPFHWPSRKFQAELQNRQKAIAEEIPVRVVRAVDSPYAHWTFGINRQNQRLIARDENGIERWTFEIAQTGAPVFRLEEVTMSLAGHVGVLAFQTHFAVLDLISRKHAARMLWSRPLVESEAELEDMMQFNEFLAAPNRLLPGAPAFGAAGPGSLNLISDELIVYQVGEKITAADAVTGKPRWTRTGVRRRSRVFGDEHRLAIVAPDASSAVILRSADGDILRVADLPEPQNQIAYDGIRLISRTTENDQQVLKCRDLGRDEILWKHDCPQDADLRKIGTDELALFHPDGRFLIVSLADGRLRVDARLEAAKQGLHHEVCRLGSCYLLFSTPDRPPAAGIPRRFLPDPEVLPVDGLVQAFDRGSGKLLWKTRLEDQSLEKLPPQDSPVIVFNKRRMAGQALGARGFADHNTFRVTILDLRTGESVFEHNQLKTVSPWNLRIQPEEKKITFTFYEGEIELKLANESLKPSGT